MTRFRNKPLQALDGIYRFIGGQRGSGEVDLDSPVAVVHDVSSQSMVGAGAGPEYGHFTVGFTVTHAGGGSLFADTDPYAALTALDPRYTVQNARIWILASNIAEIVADISMATNWLRYPVNTAAFPSIVNLPVCSGVQFNTFGDILFQRTTPIAFPLMVPVGGLLAVGSTGAAAADESEHSFVCWAGPIGAYPPWL